MTKEEILTPYIETILRHTKVVSKENALLAMQQYLEQETNHSNTCGVQLIAEERKRQINVEGWTSDYDSEHINGELADAAGCYCIMTTMHPETDDFFEFFHKHWPFSTEWWKPTPENRIRELQKAGALIAAEIDRLNQQAQF